MTCVCLPDVCLSVAYIGPKSRTETRRKTKIGKQVAHVTCDSDTTFKVKGQLAGAGAFCGGQPTACLSSSLHWVACAQNLIDFVLSPESIDPKI